MAIQQAKLSVMQSQLVSEKKYKELDRRLNHNLGSSETNFKSLLDLVPNLLKSSENSQEGSGTNQPI